MGHALEVLTKFQQEQDVSILADDFKFIGPVDQTTGAEAFMQLNAGFMPLVAGMRMLSQFETENQVCSIYEMDLNTPAEDKLTLKIADWVVVENGKMLEQRIYYDPREFVAAFRG